MRAAGATHRERENWRFYHLHNQKRGAFGWRDGNPWRMRRRDWFRLYVRIKNKAGDIVPFELNESQRRLEAQVLRMERARLPVRIIIGKARQQGFSTYVAAFQLWFISTRMHARGCIIAHRRDTSKVIFSRLRLMVNKMPRVPLRGGKTDEQVKRWEFDLPHSSRQELVFGDPMFSECVIDSAEVDEPGRGDTIQVLHMSETAMWKDAARKAQALLQVLPSLKDTYGFNESTAMGDTGWFCESFKRAWGRQTDPTKTTKEESGADAGWYAVFFPWYFHQEYRWSVINSKPMPEDLEQHVLDTLDDDEKALLHCRYLRRGIGWVTVDVDQLAWRRYAIDNLCNGQLGQLHTEYPSTPEEMFVASGSPFFDPQKIKHIEQTMVAEPILSGELEVA